jgi:hypothetical protein
MVFVSPKICVKPLFPAPPRENTFKKIYTIDRENLSGGGGLRGIPDRGCIPDRESLSIDKTYRKKTK